MGSYRQTILEKRFPVKGEQITRYCLAEKIRRNLWYKKIIKLAEKKKIKINRIFYLMKNQNIYSEDYMADPSVHVLKIKSISILLTTRKRN